MKKNKTIEFFIDNFNNIFHKELLIKVKNEAYIIYNQLKEKYKNDPKLLKKQTLNNMFPVISVYKALLRNDISKSEAFKAVNEINSLKKYKEALSTSKLLHLFGLYKLYPLIFKKVTLSSFNKEIGFDPEFIVANKKQCRFNMKQCVFCKRCKEENCFELVPVFCNTDIVFNENLHKNIVWHRDYTLANGDPYCDFDVHLKGKE